MVKRLFISLLLMTGALPGFEWETREFDGVKFVPVDEVAKFFRFEATEEDGGTVVLANRDITLKLEPGSKEIVMNRLKFGLNRAIRREGDRSWMTTVDLLECLEPVLRPGLIKGKVGVRTVVIEPFVESGEVDVASVTKWLEEALREEDLAVVDLGKVGRSLTAEKKGKALGTFEKALYLRLVLREGKEVSLRTVPLGGSLPVRQVAFALGTSVHGRALPRLTQLAAEAGDGGIGPAQSPLLPLGTTPGIQIELSMGSLEAGELGPTVAGAIAEGLKAGNRALNR